VAQGCACHRAACEKKGKNKNIKKFIAQPIVNQKI